MQVAGALIAAAALAAASPSRAGPVPPDLVLVNGHVFTADAATPYVAALAIGDGKILATGSSAAMAALAGPHTRRIDLRGHLVIPGLNDAHCHLGIDLPGTVTVQTKDLDPSWSEVRAAILKEAGRTAPGTLIEVPIGAAVLRDLSIDRRALDALSPDHPVILGTLTGHAEIANSAGLVVSGIGEDTPDPAGGRIERDASGRHTGVLREYAVLNADRHRADATPDAAAAQQLKATLDQAAAFGITTIQDMANATAPERAVRLLQGIPSVIRVRVMRMPGTTVTGRDTAEGRGTPQHPAPLITVTGTKWMLDGVGLESTFTPRAGNVDWHGAAFEELIRTLPTTFPKSEMTAMLNESLGNHDQLLLHVFGYPAAAAMLAAMEQDGGVAQWADKRVRFEHADGLFPDLIPRAKALGIVVVQNPTHFAVVGVDIEKVGQPMRSLLDAGIPVALGSDGPLNPYLSIMLAVTHPHQHSQGITRAEAVIAYTRTSAYAEFADNDKGTLAVGKLADLAVLSQDIFKVPLPQLPATKSWLTLVAGNVVYDAKRL